MKKVIIIGVSVVLVAVAVYFLNIRYGVRDREESYRGRTTQYSGIAMSVLSYYPSRHNDELPKSLEDPALQEPVNWSYSEMKEQVVFNTLYLGRKQSSLTEDERKTPFLIENEVRPSGTIVVYDYNGEGQRLTPAELGAANLTSEARVELAGVLSKRP